MSQKLDHSLDEESTQEEERVIWVEKFPVLTEQIKNQFSDHFINNDDIGAYDSKVKFETYPDKYKIPYMQMRFGDIMGCDQLTITIHLHYFRKETVQGFFSKKVKLEEDSVTFYPLHIRPPGVTDSDRHGFSFTYSDVKESRNYHNIDWFINTFWKPDFSIFLDFHLFPFLKEFQDTIDNFYEKEIKEENIMRKQKLIIDKNENILALDKDGNGEVDLVDGDSFLKLLKTNQKIIEEIDTNYIHKFVKISMYLKTKRNNTQKIFDSIKLTKNDVELNELVNLLKNQIHTYELLVFHSISMITSLLETDSITFYEIYECFDRLGVFNSNWENEVSDKLTDIGDGIKDLMYSIYHMENKIVNAIDNLTYVTQNSFRDLTNSVDKQLTSIDSSVKFNNLLTVIQTYQTYKINQNTKRIN